MTKRFSAVLAAGAVLGLAAVAACGSSDDDTTDDTTSAGADSSTSAASSEDAAATDGKVGVILPDSASSARWETADRPLLEAAFEDAGIEADIQNAQGDKAQFQTIADGMINAGVNVLLIVNLDSETGSAVIQKATDAGIPVVDYDRLTLGGGAAYYVSFDNVAVGTAIGEGLVTCLQDAGTTTGGVVELNGSPTDNNATLFKQGYDAAIKAAGYTVAADQSVPEWDNTEAGTIFEQIFTSTGGSFVGVAAANDGLGGAVVSVLDRNGLAGTIPVTGQDATDEGLQRVLTGTQCVTIYKPIKQEAEAAAQIAISLAQGDTAAADALATGSVTDTETNEDVPAVLLDPVSVFRDNVKQVIDDGFTTADKVCVGDAAAACTELGIS